MSGRRLRIKAAVNLGSKRKNIPGKPNDQPKEEIEDASENVKKFKEETSITDPVNVVIEKEAGVQESSPQFVTNIKENVETFKCPPNIEYKKTSHDGPPANYIEENVFQLDLQKFSNNNASPTKARQRIKATPIFGHRRNSLVGSSSPFQIEEEPIVISTNYHNSPHTKQPIQGTGRIRTESGSATGRIRTESGGMNRIRTESGGFTGRIRTESGSVGRNRTESGCSAYSDSYSRDAPNKHRKTGHDEHRILTKKQINLKFNGKPPEKSSLKMFDLIYYNPTTNPMQTNLAAVKNIVEQSKPLDLKSEELNTDESATKGAFLVPQLKLGSNGEMMIDEKSLEIETTAEKEARKVLANTNLIVLDENSGNNGFYRRQKRTKEWSPDETLKFYKCLHTVGTDFSLMLSLFPTRTRRDLKLKFKKEEKCNINLINKALLFPKIFDIDELQKQLDRDEQEKLEKEAQWKQIEEKEGRRSDQKVSQCSKNARCLKDGVDVYKNECVTKKKLSNRALKKAGTKKTKKIKVEDNTKLSEMEEQKAFEMLVNDDDLYQETKLPRSFIDAINCDTVDSVISTSTDGINIESILNALNNNSLAIVSSEDPNDNEKIVYEIYTFVPETGELESRPLDLPEDVVNIIISAMS